MPELNITYADFYLKNDSNNILPSPITFLLSHMSRISPAVEVEHSIFLHFKEEQHEIWQATNMPPELALCGKLFTYNETDGWTPDLSSQVVQVSVNGRFSE